MHKLYTKHQGFGLVGVLAVIVLISALGLVGHYVASNNKNTNTPTPISNSKANNAKPRGKLVIKEWGVALDQSSLTTDLIYVMQNPDQDGVQRLLLSYKGLPELDPACTPTKTDFGTLARFTPSSIIKLSNGQTKTVSDIQSDKAVMSVLDRYKKVGDNYYLLETNSFRPYCGSSQQAKDFLDKSVYTDGFVSLSDPTIQSSIRLVSQ